MKPSEQRLSKSRRQHIEALVARHVRELFKRLPMLSGFWLRPDLKAELSVFTWLGCSSEWGLYEEVMRSLAALAEERPEAVQLMRGRTFARGSTDAAAHARADSPMAPLHRSGVRWERLRSQPDRGRRFATEQRPFPDHSAVGTTTLASDCQCGKHLDDPQHRF